MEQIFTLWPTLADLASDLRKPYPTVAAWKQRGSIPAHYDLALIRAAALRGKALTLHEIASARESSKLGAA
jgi:hypothetical protein